MSTANPTQPEQPPDPADVAALFAMARRLRLRATMAQEPDREARYRLFAAHFGVRPSGERPCPRIVATQACAAGGGGCCVCQLPAASRFLQNARMWVNSAGTHLLSAEPLRVGPDADDDLEVLLLELHLIGLQFRYGDRLDSPFLPGGAGLILILPERPAAVTGP